MKYLLTFLFVITLCYNTLHSQKNNAKLHISPFAFLEARAGFERAISEKSSLQANLGVLIPSKVPGWIYDDSGVQEYGVDADLLNKLSGFTFGLEYRLYPGSKRDIPRGFYLGPYFKYNSYSISTSLEFEYILTQDEYTNDLTPEQRQRCVLNPDGFTYTIDALAGTKATFVQMGGGIEIGYQWLINDMLSIDWTIIGIGIESDAFIMDITSDDIPVDYEKWSDNIEEEVRSFVSNDIFDLSDKVDVEAKNNKVRASLQPLVLPAFKFTMISIGITF